MRKYMAEIVCTVGSCDKQMVVIRGQEKLEPSCCAPFTYYIILF